MPCGEVGANPPHLRNTQPFFFLFHSITSDCAFYAIPMFWFYPFKPKDKNPLTSKPFCTSMWLRVVFNFGESLQIAAATGKPKPGSWNSGSPDWLQGPTHVHCLLLSQEL